MSDYSTLVTRALSLVNDPNASAELTTQMQDDALREALSRYDLDVPLRVVEDLTGDGSLFDFALASWVDQFSSVSSVEYPAGYRPATFVDPNDYEIYQTSSTTKLRLKFDTPGSGETVRVNYNGRHTIEDLDSAAATTIYAGHEEAIVRLAASNLLLRLATLYLHEQGGTLVDADAINRSSKSDIARRLANALEADYRNYLGIESGVVAAGGVVDWDTTFAGSGLARLTHPSRWR